MSEARWDFVRRIIWPLLRDVLVCVVGLGGVIYEVVSSGVERPTLLALLAAMIGAPLFFRADERNGKGKE